MDKIASFKYCHDALKNERLNSLVNFHRFIQFFIN